MRREGNLRYRTQLIGGGGLHPTRRLAQLWWKPMKTFLLAIAALICMTSFAGAQPACAPFPWCAHGNWLDKHCWCYRYRGPQWSHGNRWGDDEGWGGDGGDDGGGWNDEDGHDRGWDGGDGHRDGGDWNDGNHKRGKNRGD
jgi:hypothetical protein